MEMTNDEFDLMDELYFVQPYSELKGLLGWADERLLNTLASLYQKTYVKCFETPDQEIFDQADVMGNGLNMYYLATKKGLLAHNTR